MHGGTTAIFAVMGLACSSARAARRCAQFVPGFALAVLLHSGVQPPAASPRLATLAVILVLPPLL